MKKKICERTYTYYTITDIISYDVSSGITTEYACIFDTKQGKLSFNNYICRGQIGDTISIMEECCGYCYNQLIKN